MKSIQELFLQKKYDAVLEATANSESSSDIFLRLQCFDALDLHDEWLNETQRHLFKLLPMIEWIIEKHIFLLQQQKITRTKSMTLKTMYDTLPYLNQTVEELLREFNLSLMQDQKPGEKLPLSPAMILQWFRDKKYGALFDGLAEDHTISPDVIQTLQQQLQQKLPAMVQTYLLLVLQRLQFAEIVCFERQGLQYEVVPKDLSPLHELPLIQTMNKAFEKVKDPSQGLIARQLFEKWVAMTYPFFLTEDRDWLLPAFQIIAARYLKISTLANDLQAWLDHKVHRIFLEEILALIEDPSEQIG